MTKRLVIQLRKAGLTAGSIAAMVPQDLEGVGRVGRVVTRQDEALLDDDEQDGEDRPDSDGPQQVGPPRGASSVREARDEEMTKGTRYKTPKGSGTGTPIAYGVKGATVVDHRTGTAVRVDHGHYLHEDEDEDKPSWKETAASHLDLGPRSPLAIHAVHALAADAGCEESHACKRKQVSVGGHKATIGGKSVDDPRAAAITQWLVDREGPDEDLWSWEEGGKRKRVTAESVAAYRAKIGALPPPEATTTAGPAPRSKAQPKLALRTGKAAMRKADTRRAVTALHGIPASTGSARWTLRGYTAELRHSKGLAVVSIMGKGLALPFHILVKDEKEARIKAADAVANFERGTVPFDGVFRQLVLS